IITPPAVSTEFFLVKIDEGLRGFRQFIEAENLRCGSPGTVYKITRTFQIGWCNATSGSIEWQVDIQARHVLPDDSEICTQPDHKNHFCPGSLNAGELRGHVLSPLIVRLRGRRD